MHSIFVQLQFWIVCIQFMIIAVLPGLNASTQKKIKFDSSGIQIRAISNNQIVQHQNDKRFQYHQQSIIPLSLTEKTQLWLWQHIFRHIIHRRSISFIKWFFYIAIVFGLILIIIRLLKMKYSSLFFKSKEIPDNIYSSSLNNSDNKTNFNRLIQDALENRHYRWFVRYSYIHAIQRLSENKYIRWREEKTNRDYIKELTDMLLKLCFSKITNHFEYICYGNFTLTESNFILIKDDFDQFFKQLSQSKNK